MAHNSHITNKKKPTQQTTSRKISFTSKKFIVALAGLLVVLLGFWWFVGGGSQINEQKKMANYLKGKYGQEFVVENIRTDGSGFGVRGETRGDAYPKNNTKMIFRIASAGGGYHDQYAGAIWSDAEESALRGRFGGQLEWPSSLKVNIAIYPPDDVKVNSPIPKLRDALEKYRIKIAYDVVISEKIYDSAQDERYLKTIKTVAEQLKDVSTYTQRIDYKINIDKNTWYGATLDKNDLLDLLNSGDKQFNQIFSLVRKEK
ncbi:MAG: hypothetical protein WAQ24_01030 [Candidatus Saccharimonadales bacterium]